VEWSSFRFRFRDFVVRIWRAKAWPRFTFPDAVFLKRLAAPLCVFNFNFGIQFLKALLSALQNHST
jgi:hypothetical protein